MNIKNIFVSLAMMSGLAYAAANQPVAALPSYEPTWESLSQHDETPQWLKDAKFGIYFHWGIYSVPAYGGEWYPYGMYRQNTNYSKHHLEKYGKDFNYHDFVPMFKAEKFDAKDWAQLFKDAGARFAGPCASHHDGFAMWDSEVNPWNVVDKGPKRDILGLLYKELHAEGLKTIATLHHARNIQRYADVPKQWARSGNSRCGGNSHFAYDPDLITSTTDPELKYLYGNLGKEEGVQYWKDIVAELGDKYSPDVIWFDSWLDQIPEKARQEMVAHYYNAAAAKGQEVTIAYKQKDLPEAVGINDIEQGGHFDVESRTWMTDVTLSYSSWCYIEGQTYKTSDMVLRNMIDVWSKNGVVLLNISPKADGTICDVQRKVLHDMGDWLKVYGEAVYNTHPHTSFGFGSAEIGKGHFGGQSATNKYSADDIRFTVANDGKSFYVFYLGVPEAGSTITLPALPYTISSATLMGADVAVKMEVKDKCISLTMPEGTMNPLANVVKLVVE